MAARLAARACAHGSRRRLLTDYCELYCCTGGLPAATEPPWGFLPPRHLSNNYYYYYYHYHYYYYCCCCYYYYYYYYYY